MKENPHNRKHGWKRSRGEREADYTALARLYCRQHTIDGIVEWIAKNRPYTLSRRQIVIDLRRIRSRWVESQVMDFNAQRLTIIERLNEVNRAAWDVFDKSQQDAVTIEQSGTKGGDNGNTSRALKRTEAQAGDVRCLEVISRNNIRIAELLGIVKSVRTEAFASDGSTISVTQTEVAVPGRNAEQRDKILSEYYLKKAGVNPVIDVTVSEPVPA